MLNMLLAGVGGQGTVLAAKLLAQAATSKGWRVRTAETIGMAQRGGSVVSHVRLGNLGEDVHTPLLMKGTADMIIAFEPGEGARVLPYRAPQGVLVTAMSEIQPVTSALSTHPYESQTVIYQLRNLLPPGQLVVVDDAHLIRQVGSPRVLNTLMLACAISKGCGGLTEEDLREAVRSVVKPALVDINLVAVDAASSFMKNASVFL